jgi:cell division protein FtsL
MAARRVAPRRGRAWVALALLGFVLIGAGVIWRRAAGVAEARELRTLEQRRLQLQAERAQLESDIRDLSSRSKLVPIAERRLGMHIPSDTQVVIIPRIVPAP